MKLVSFEFDGITYDNFDIENDETVHLLLKKGVPNDLIEQLKNQKEPPTDNELLMDYIVDVDYRVVLIELGLI